jgi:ketosteroid isomerase-like protein
LKKLTAARKCGFEVSLAVHALSNVLYRYDGPSLEGRFALSNETIKLFDRFCSGFVDKDARKAVEVFGNDAKFLAPGLSEISGKKALAEFFAGELPNIDDYSLSKLETFEKGDKTVVEWQNRYKDKRTGRPHQVYGVTIISIKNGLIQEMREYCNIPPA